MSFPLFPQREPITFKATLNHLLCLINRKGLCSTHFKDVSDYFRGAHLTVNAREEDEVDEAELIAKVTKAS